jgi:hypothetical protein
MVGIMRRLIATLLIGAVVIGFAPASQASLPEQTVLLALDEPVAIPGMVLAPGKYLLERTTPGASPEIVIIWNAEKTRVYARLHAVAVYRETPAEEGLVTLLERGRGLPRILETLFYPGDRAELRFIYPLGDQAGARFVYRTTVVGKARRVRPLRLPSAWEPVVLRVDWTNRQEFDLDYAFLMFILGWDQVPHKVNE